MQGSKVLRRGGDLGGYAKHETPVQFEIAGIYRIEFHYFLSFATLA